MTLLMTTCGSVSPNRRRRPGSGTCCVRAAGRPLHVTPTARDQERDRNSWSGFPGEPTRLKAESVQAGGGANTSRQTELECHYCSVTGNFYLTEQEAKPATWK